MKTIRANGDVIVLADPGYNPQAARWWWENVLPARLREGPVVIIISKARDSGA